MVTAGWRAVVGWEGEQEAQLEGYCNNPGEDAGASDSW